MIKRMTRIMLIVFFLLISTVFFSFQAYGQQSQSLEEGIGLYEAERYDEAVNSFLKAREEAPGSSTAAFFLGMAYKQLMDYEEAEDHLRDAVTLTPKIRESLIELIDVTVRQGKTEEAKKWIAVAEQEGIQPANAAFLKGIALSQEGKNKEAAASFEKAKSLDPDMAQASEIQIALSHLRDSELENAKTSFESAITVDPQTDLAGFARQYLAGVEEAIEAKKPFHFTLSLFEQYDTNMVLKPTDEILATNVTDEESLVTNAGFRVTYSPTIKGPWLFNSYYALSASLHQNHKKTHDSIINTLSVTPGYNFGKASLNLAATYSYAFVRNPDYEKYSANLNAGPMVRIAINKNQLLEVFAGYADNDYFQPVYLESEDRDSSGLSAYTSWVWLFKEDTFLNVRYEYLDQDATGDNWDNRGHSLSAVGVIPVMDNVKIHMSGKYSMKDFTNTHTIFDEKREDRIYNVSAGVAWTFYRKTSLIGQATRIGNGSNIGIYDYNRNLFTLGLEYRF